MAVDANPTAVLTALPAARAARLMTRCDELASHSEEAGHITRPYGTPALRAAQAVIADWMRAGGMDVRTDAIGTVRGRYEGQEPERPALLIGSHFDSVRDAGRYDGVLGVLAGIGAVERLAASGRRLPFPIEVVAFPDEEGLRFQTTYLGSCALAGGFDPELLEFRDRGGVSVRQAIAEFGGDPDAIASSALQPGAAFAYVEAHIEQGPYLESIDAPVGVVSAICGQSRIVASFRGEAGHAGTVAMALRRDPAPAAAELVLEAEALARRTPGLLATVGRIEVSPGASNVIPGRVELTLDVRHPEDAVRREARDILEGRGHEIAEDRSLRFAWQIMREHAAVTCDQRLSDRLRHAAQASGVRAVDLPSGAGHDAVMMARCLPVAMLFVRCAGGISHSPAESVATEDVATALDVLDHFLDGLADGGL